MDLDFGITTWYYKPTFYLKISWLIMSVSALIYEMVLLSEDFDKYYPIVIGKGPGNLTVFIYLFTIIACVGSLITYKKLFLSYRKYILYATALVTGLNLIFVVSYAGSYGNNRRFREDANTISNFNFFAKTEEELELVKWFKNRSNGDVETYVKNRTIRASKDLLGVLLTWFFLQIALLFLFLQERDFEGLGDTKPAI